MRKWLRHNVHSSWWLAGCSVGILSGAALAIAAQAEIFRSALWLLLAAGLLSLAAMIHTRLAVSAAVLAGLLIGVWRGAGEHYALGAYASFYDKSVLLSGTITEDTSYGPRGDQRIMLGSVRLNGQPLHGHVWVSSLQSTLLKRSDIVSFRGRLKHGFGTLPASMSYARVIGVQHPQPPDVALRIRDWFAAAIRRAIPQPQAALGVGYLVGQRSTLPHDLDAQLKTVGLTHAVVASGYNLTILVGFARRSLLKTSKYLATIASGALVAGFILMSGLSPSMTRAGLVTGLGIAAWYYGRTVHPLVLLPGAAAVSVLLAPAYAWGDIGWCLSFASFAGVLLLAPLLQRFFWGRHSPRAVWQVVLETSSAQLFTLPIMIGVFGHYSVYGLLANVLVLPLIPLAMALSFVSGIAGLALPAVAHWIGLPATWLLQYMTGVVGWVANLPGADGSFSLSRSGLVVSYLALAGLTGLLWRATGYRFREHNIRGENAYE